MKQFVSHVLKARPRLRFWSVMLQGLDSQVWTNIKEILEGLTEFLLLFKSC